MDLERVAREIIQYEKICQELEKSGDSENHGGLYNKRLCLESELRDTILTALDFTKMNIIKEEEKWERKANIYKKGILTLGKKYRKLGEKSKEEIQNEAYQLFEEKVERIETIISGKKGIIVNEIKEALEFD